MKFHSTLPFRASVIGLAVHISGAAAQFAQEYCSSDNTGSDYDQVHDIYNSNLACSDQCKANYAFAVVQYQNCWCTNYIPADQQSIGSCNESCPGYPDDNCGSEKAGLFGYIALSNVQPSGTAGAGSSSAASSAASSTTAPSTSTELVSTPSSSLPASTSTTLTTDAPTTTSLSFTSSTDVAAPTSSPSTPSFLVVDPSTLSSVSSTESSRTSESTSNSPQSSTETSTTPPPATSRSQLPTSTITSQQTSYVSSTYYRTSTRSRSSSTVVSQHPPTSESTSSYIAPTTSTTPTISSSSFEVGGGTTNLYIAPGPVATEEQSSSITPSATPSPVTSVRVVTVSGARVTQTVTSTPIIAGGAQADAGALHRNSLSDGAIAGAVIGSILGIAALLIAAFLFWRRKKQDTNDDNPSKPFAFGNMKRNVSVLSKTGLLSRGRPASVAEREYEEPSSLRRSIMLAAGGADLNGVSSVSPLGSSHGDTGSQSRHSRPMVYDQRLNPSAIFANQENGSRLSIQDQQDYSRPLGVTNPDIRPSFESRDSRLY